MTAATTRVIARQCPGLKSTGHLFGRKGGSVNGDTDTTGEDQEALALADLKAIRDALNETNRLVEQADALQAHVNEVRTQAGKSKKAYHDAIRTAMANRHTTAKAIREAANIPNSTLYWLLEEEQAGQ